VRLKPSGWGTKVTLTVTREVPEPEPVPHPESALEPELVAEPEPVPHPESALEPELVLEPEPVVEPALEPRRGFFARFFGRRPKVEPEPEHETEPPAAVEEIPDVSAEQKAADLAAELAALEESLVVETQAVLTTVLDRLGAAHHRPFSRS
jgi:fused signal recognition particle receptor